MYIFRRAKKKSNSKPLEKIIIIVHFRHFYARILLKTTRQEDNVCHQSPGRFGRRLRARDSKSGKESSVSVRVRAV